MELWKIVKFCETASNQQLLNTYSYLQYLYHMDVIDKKKYIYCWDALKSEIFARYESGLILADEVESMIDLYVDD